MGSTVRIGCGASSPSLAWAIRLGSSYGSRDLYNTERNNVESMTAFNMRVTAQIPRILDQGPAMAYLLALQPELTIKK